MMMTVMMMVMVMVMVIVMVMVMLMGMMMKMMVMCGQAAKSGVPAPGSAKDPLRNIKYPAVPDPSNDLSQPVANKYKPPT
eukprot:9481835-Karenia_brevis.AAC.1